VAIGTRSRQQLGDGHGQPEVGQDAEKLQEGHGGRETAVAGTAQVTGHDRDRNHSQDGGDALSGYLDDGISGDGTRN
jgi:hypothetical protein